MISTDRAPTTPGARRCESTALEGPSAAPAGAITVTTGDDLTQLVKENAPGTTDWLEPGTHKLPNGQYSQVIPQEGDVGFLSEGNYISDNDAEGIMYETNYNAAILHNTFVRNALVKGPTNPGFPASAIYLSESGSDSRVPGPYNDVLRIAGNVFSDNWSGIVAWENADRFAGSPSNTSSGSTTLVNPDASLDACKNKANIAKRPFIDDCRWKTQNLVVESNDFSVDTSEVPLCVRSRGCGFNGLFSNYGTYPEWSPFKADMVEHNITFEQNNVWRNNAYTGEWHFMAKEAGQTVSWEAWRSDPHHQDAESTFTP